MKAKRKAIQKTFERWEVIQKSNFEPMPDLAECEQCGWSGKVVECIQDEDGDWETGYFQIDTCPKCSGGIEYNMSADVAEEWSKWHKKSSRL